MRKYTKVYEMSLPQFLMARQLFRREEITHFTHFGMFHCLIEVIGDPADIAYAETLLQRLWVTRENSVFPKRHKQLVCEELQQWEIDYTIVRNPLAFEIRTEIDQRLLDRFLSHIRDLTKKRRKARAPKGDLARLVPDDARHLFD